MFRTFYIHSFNSQRFPKRLKPFRHNVGSIGIQKSILCPGTVRTKTKEGEFTLYLFILDFPCLIPQVSEPRMNRRISKNIKIAYSNTLQLPVGQKLDSAIHRINPHPLDKYYELRYPLDSDLSGGWLYQPFEQLGPYGRIKTQLVQLLRESLGNSGFPVRTLTSVIPVQRTNQLGTQAKPVRSWSLNLSLFVIKDKSDGYIISIAE